MSIKFPIWLISFLVRIFNFYTDTVSSTGNKNIKMSSIIGNNSIKIQTLCRDVLLFDWIEEKNSILQYHKRKEIFLFPTGSQRTQNGIFSPNLFRLRLINVLDKLLSPRFASDDGWKWKANKQYKIKTRRDASNENIFIS